MIGRIGLIGRAGLASVLLCVMVAGALQAASFTYSTQTKRIRAGVIIPAANPVIGYTDPLDRPDPYVFYVMDARQDLKPAGWQIENPLASSHVTEDIYTRWMTAAPKSAATDKRPYVYEVGQRVTKDMGCYWEVPISTDSDDLAQYDILLLTSYGQLNFDRWEREKLRKFVDNGGILWIEHRRSATTGFETQLTSSSNFFIRGLAFGPSGAGSPPPPAVTASTALSHSLVNRPFLLLWKDINLLGRWVYNASGNYYPEYYQTSIVLEDPPYTDALNYFSQIVMRDAAHPIIVAAQYGSGYVVVSSESIGQAISEPLGPGGVNDGTFKGLLPAANSEDLRFAYNIINWGSEHTTIHKGARRTGFSFAEIGAPLRPLWTYRTPATPDLSRTDHSPAILDDTVFYVDNLNVLHAFDLSPVRDRDGNGDPDDGIPDYSTGSSCDELWNYQLPELSSSPTVAYVPNDGVVVPTVFVQTKSGKVMSFNATAIEKETGKRPPQWPASEPDTTYFNGAAVVVKECKPGAPVPSPTYADGTLYVGDGWGVMHAHPFFPAAPEWAYPDPTNPQNERGAASSPTVGYLHDQASGATEGVAYLAQRAWGADAILKAYPIRSFNEVLIKLPNTNQYRTRSSNTPILVDPNTWNVCCESGGSITPILPPDVSVVNSPGGRFEIAAGYTIPEGAILFADYQLDYSDMNPTYTYHRQISIQTDGTTKAGINDSPAISKKDIVYFSTDNGSIYAVKETGMPQSGEPPLVYKWRWCMQDTSAVSYFGTTLLPFGSPAVANDLVYFAANDLTNNQGYILAFKADPEFVIRLGEAINRGNRVIVRQQDAINKNGSGYWEYTGVTATDVNKVPGSAIFTVNYERGELRFVNFRLTGSPAHQPTVSQGMSIVYTPAAQNPNDVVVETTKEIEPFDPILRALNPDWNNLVWHMRVPVTITSSPMIMGDILYIGLWDGSIGEIDLAHKTIPSEGPRPVTWGDTGGTEVPNAWAERPLPGIVPTQPLQSTAAGSHGMLVVSTADGLGVLYSPSTLVAEPDQIAEINANGNKTWICDATTSYVTTSSADSSSNVSEPVMGATKTPLNKPSVARRASIGGTLVADTGNNRVILIDRAGIELWKITDFVDPASLLPPGSSLSLNKPTDVTMWAVTELDDPNAPNGPYHPAYHYLIADSGNYRVLEIVARFNPDPAVNGYQNILRWTTNTLAKGKQYRFTTVRPAMPLNNVYDEVEHRYITVGSLVCTISNYDTNDNTPDVTGGALLQIDMATNTTQIITGLPIDSANPSVHLFNPTFFNRQYISNNEWHDVVIDAIGIHVVSYIGGALHAVRTYKISDHQVWCPAYDPMLDIPACQKRPLSPSYAQYLPNGNVLVANRAVWKNIAGQEFFGEVFEIAPVDTTTDPSKTKMQLVPASSAVTVRQPMSAERQIF